MRKLLVICLLLFELFAIQTAGQMNSDPAPGRSPGPPTPTLTNIVVAGAKTKRIFKYNELQIQITTQKDNETEVQEGDEVKEATVKDDNSTENATTFIANVQASDASEINFELRKSHIFKDTTTTTTTTSHSHSNYNNNNPQKTHAGGSTRPTYSFESHSTLLLQNVNAVLSPPVAAEIEHRSNKKIRSVVNTETTKTTKPAISPVSTTDAFSDTTTSRSGCREKLSEFLNDVVVIDEDNNNNNDDDEIPPAGATTSTTAKNINGTQQLRIELQLEHDIFDTTTMDINCGLMYKVRLITSLPHASHQSPTKSHTSTQQSLPPTPPHYTGEFFVESLSVPNGRERGNFVDYALGNKLPISWFSALQRNSNSYNNNNNDNNININGNDKNDGNTWMPNDESISNVAAEFKKSRNLFTSATNSARNTFLFRNQNGKTAYEQQQESLPFYAPNKRTQQKMNVKRESGREAAANMCPDNKWTSSTKSHINAANGEASTESVGLWLVNELCEQDDTIEFRVFFRFTLQNGDLHDFSGTNNNNNNSAANDATTEAQSLVYKKTFIFKLIKDCQLQLREATSGTLDYTTLPLYSIDCTVHFPSYEHTWAKTEQPHPPNDTPPPGILVELRRLNVPCSSGGYVRFNERSELCGKLEELHDTDRAYHFDVRQRTSVRFYKNPMFSMSYKLVDHCYNITTSNQTGEYYIQPSRRDALECYFLIHLPYGNRIWLQLVTNNESAIMQWSDEASENGDGNDWLNERNPSMMYTILGAGIDTQVINLTTNGNAFGTRQHAHFGGKTFEPFLALNNSSVSGGTSKPLSGVLKIAHDSFAFLNTERKMNTLGTANCGGVVIKVFENDHSKWSHCINSTHLTRAFLLESTSNTLSIHLFRASRNPQRYGYSGDSFIAYGPLEKTRSGSSNNRKELLPAIYLSYQARPVPEIVSNCAFGWVATQQFCVSAIEQSVSWHEAEQHCVNLGGHLASIRNDLQQQTVNEMLLHSPGYRDQNAYWVGGSDKSYEGDFRWSDGLSFQYTNWFPGWTQHSHYNKQPNDDGLSSQDCIELRRYFRTPPGIQTQRSPLTSSFMWNDRDCSAKNFFVCERAMSDESLRRTWINDCNKTVSLSKEHPRASIWSPSFPRQYPDNANCFTTITAPAGYRIVIEFEELVIENEPGCTYDYLEITEPTQMDLQILSKSSKQKTANTNNNNNNKINLNLNNNFNNNNNNKIFRKRNSYDNPSLNTFTSTSTTSSSSTSSYAASNAHHSYANDFSNLNFNFNLNENSDNSDTSSTYAHSAPANVYNFAQSNYQKLLHIFASLYKPRANFLIQTPDYPKGKPHYSPQTHQQAVPNAGIGIGGGGGGAVGGGIGVEEIQPKRLCGDWSSKLKLLRHVTLGPYLGLHFMSDYSHHFGGYKAKVYMQNRSQLLRAASECANERLKPYNGSCYLFVSYPEVDWWTAQQVCRGMGATLTSVSSSDEHRFITSNIRNQIDYSPQTIYWLGAELEKSGQFEWTDDTKMSFQGWLPGQGQFDVMPADATCLGLQWKMSPTPMLPSGLYWQSQKCNKIGGYVCKKPKETFGEFAFKNLTVTGTEGRLVSPSYPNTYPLNMDYWIQIKSPERSRIIVQFQKIDLEPQDECLYDYVSIQDYELMSRLTLEPGTNLLPIAMLTSSELMTPIDNVELFEEYSRTKRSISASNTAIKKKQQNYTNSKQKQDFLSKTTIATEQIQMYSIKSNKDKYVLATGQKNSIANEDSKGSSGTSTYNSNSKSNNRSTNSNNNGNGNGNIYVSDKENNGNVNDIKKANENPKRRRRKRSLQEMKNILSGEITTPYHHDKSPQHKMHQRKRRSATQVVGGANNGGGGDGSAKTGDAHLRSSSGNAQTFLPYVRWCGVHDSNMSKFDFVSSSNQVVFNFHSDYSITGLGFSAVWKAIDISGCPLQTLTSREGNIYSPNYPHFLLNNLDCAYVIQAPAGRRVWLEFTEFDLSADAMLELDIGNGLFRPFRMREHVNEGIFVSLREQLRVQFKTGQHPRGKGFQAIYHTVGPTERRERVINLTNNATGYLFQLNYPHDMPENVDFTQHLVAPFGDNILLELHGVEFSENGCPDNNVLEIYDNYADNNGTRWQLCKFEKIVPNADGSSSSSMNDNFFGSTEENPYGYDSSILENENARKRHQEHQQQSDYNASPVYITSYLNTLHIRQRANAKSDADLNATVRIQWDNNYKMKLANDDKTVESCQPNPCQYNGKCVVNNGTSYCQCQGHYTGKFCGLNICELEPCVFGRCELTATSYKCKCQPGYMGSTCEQKQRPCADNPCEGRGICFEKNGGYFCRCHAWWEGPRCERRMLHIPYKPLSERMLQEPFWLGLITVFVVLAVIGLVWCAKRHFPEKIEKLLAEEADRNRPPGSIHGHHHHTSLREQLQFTTAIPQTTVNTAPGAPRSIFNRLGIRKPSLLSLSSPNSTPGGGGAAARTFSLDDLLRPPPRRSPSPRKKRNNSTPVKKNAAEKKQILQQLVSPAAPPAKPKMSLGELITMSENRLRVSNADSESDLKETTFSENSISLASTAIARTIADPKLEKKVTFARLLNKVSAEMSSGSEVDMGLKSARNSSALSLPTDIQFRASSMPPSPCTNDIRSPHSTSSNQGSDSLSSSDLALTDFGLRSMQTSASEIGGAMNGLPMGMPVRTRIGATGRPKVSSADSILAMFRNFASSATIASNTTTATMPSNSSVFVSPSTTPTASSPPDDALGDDETSTSSMHTPVSFSSGAPDSPVFYRQTTIEVPVLDVLNAHKSSSPTSSTSSSSTNLLHPPTILLEIPNNGINKCLSPIREMPTPIPSPALTPIMPRPQRSNSPIFQEDPLSGGDYSDDEDKSDRSDRSELSEKLLGLQREQFRMHDSDEERLPTSSGTSASTADINKKQTFSNLPILCLSPASASNSPTSTHAAKSLVPPMITIDIEPPTPEEKVPRPRDLIIPTLTVEQPSPTKNRLPLIIFPGSPPPQRASIGETSFMFPNKQQQKRLLKQFEKPNSLDFPHAPPMITVTSNMSELESDAELLSPANKNSGAVGLMPPNPAGMCYLSPFTMCSRADRTISESNLSSSGYSSMASPGPSRCGSSNPLCPNEMDEPGSGHSAAGLSLHINLLNRRRSAQLPSCKENITNGKGSGASNNSEGNNTAQLQAHRPRSDSETFSDDVLMESNDEGIGTDHVDEKLDDHRLSGIRLKELNMFMEDQVLIEVDEPPAISSSTNLNAVPTQMAQLQLPSIVIQIDGNEKVLSPVSSRSESPLSERAGIGRFSPHFYGRKDQLPFTDSDGLYDFPSSDGKGTSAQSYTHQRRSSSKKRERKSSKCSATQSPTKQQQHLDVPSKESLTTTSPSGNTHICNKHCNSLHHPCPAATGTTRKSPKRRPMTRMPIASSSSSSESLISAKEVTARPLPRRLNSPNRDKRPRKQESLSEDEVADALLRRISPSLVKEETPPKPKCKINRLRAIGNQIRFLRRLEKSIKTRERIASPTDSCPEENTDDMDSPQATSPLLQATSPNKSRLALCRQKRLTSGNYGITAADLNSSNWKGMDRSLIGDDLNSD